MHFPKADVVAYLLGDGNYTQVYYLDGRKELFALTLRVMLAKQFPTFLRTHKRCAVNPDRVTSLVRYNQTTYFVIVKIAGQDRQLPIARRRRMLIKAQFDRLPTKQLASDYAEAI